MFVLGNFLSLIKIILGKISSWAKQIVTTGQFFDYMDIYVNRRKLVDNEVITNLLNIVDKHP